LERKSWTLFKRGRMCEIGMKGVRWGTFTSRKVITSLLQNKEQEKAHLSVTFVILLLLLLLLLLLIL
jgi:hypothetical protein